jgi:hypothetical protein
VSLDDPRRRRPWRTTAALTLAVVGAVCLTAGAGLLARAPALSVAAAGAPAPPAVASPSPPPSPVQEAPPRADAPSRAGAPPARQPAPAVAGPELLSVPDADVLADVVPVGLAPDGALEVPDDPDVLGWWSSGAVPGSTAGSTVVAAHIDTADAGTGPMLRLVGAPLGAAVEVTTTDGTAVAYRVVERRSYPKADGLPRDLFAADGPPRLVLITCGGAFDRTEGHYVDNIVIIADPA